MKKNLLSLAFVAMGVSTTLAGSYDLTYAGNGEAQLFGANSVEGYQIAIRINNPVFTGCKVTGFEVGIPMKQEGLSDVSGWLSTALKDTPDICTKEGTVDDNYKLAVNFDEPYTIPESGVWVGYGFNVTSLSKEFGTGGYPIDCMTSNTDLDNGLWIRTSNNLPTWTNIAALYGVVSTMVVHLETEFGPYDVSITLPDEVLAVKGKNIKITGTLINFGTAKFNNVFYSYKIGDISGTASTILSKPLTAGSSTQMEIELPQIDMIGDYELELTIEATNGHPNECSGRTAKSMLSLIAKKPVVRPLVEEFTGLGCGYCPRGYVTMEEMNKMYGDMFVGLAYHSQTYETGCMVTVPNSEFPFSIPGFPYADINREKGMDPAYLPYYWESYTTRIEPMEVDVKAEWADEDHTEIVATASVNFVKNLENANYKLSFCLVADNLNNPSWRQSNFYSGEASGDGIESDLWDIFLKGGSKVGGLTFNDVVAYYKDLKGIDGSIPTSVKAGEPITYEYRVKMENVTNMLGRPFLTDGAKLKMVAIVLDPATGYSVNCNKSNSLVYGEESGVKNVADDLTVVGVEYHNLQGVKVTKPTNGIVIRTEILSDGSRRSSKISLR